MLDQAAGQAWRDRLWAYVQLTRFDRPVGSEVVGWPT